MGYKLGRIFVPDERDKTFAIRAILPPKPPVRWWRYWWDEGWWGDQGATSQCVAYSWTHWLKDGPVLQSQTFDPVQIFNEAQALDELPGTNYEGTTVRGGAKALAKRGLVKEYRWAWDFQTVLETLKSVGPVVVGTNWYECAVPGTKVLTCDLRWVTVESLQPGDGIVGFDESADRQAKYRAASVVQSTRIVRPCVEMKTDRGTITVSESHPFVHISSIGTHSGFPTKQGRRWAVARELMPGDKIAYFGEPWNKDESYEAGWLAGFYDGEGSLSSYNQEGAKRNVNLLTASQKDGVAMETALRILQEKGFDYRLYRNRATGVWQWYLVGDNAKCRFLGSVRPQRLLAVSERAWLGHPTFKKGTPPATVESVRCIGEEEVIALGTNIGTLVTDGFLSHNSMFAPDARGRIRIGGPVAGGHAYVLNGFNDLTKSVRIKNSWGRAWGSNGHGWISYVDMQRLLSEQGEACIAIEVAK